MLAYAFFYVKTRTLIVDAVLRLLDARKHLVKHAVRAADLVFHFARSRNVFTSLSTGVLLCKVNVVLQLTHNNVAKVKHVHSLFIVYLLYTTVRAKRRRCNGIRQST